MLYSSTYTAAVALSFAAGALAAIGPIATLDITNGAVSPDGISREAVLAGGQFTGPLIQGTKVHISI